VPAPPILFFLSEWAILGFYWRLLCSSTVTGKPLPPSWPFPFLPQFVRCCFVNRSLFFFRRSSQVRKRPLSVRSPRSFRHPPLGQEPFMSQLSAFSPWCFHSSSWACLDFLPSHLWECSVNKYFFFFSGELVLFPADHSGSGCFWPASYPFPSCLFFGARECLSLVIVHLATFAKRRCFLDAHLSEAFFPQNCSDGNASFLRRLFLILSTTWVGVCQVI